MRSAQPSLIYLSAEDEPREGVERMRFKLTYRGPLKAHRVNSEGHADKMAPHIHAIRRHFHLQLKELWQTNRMLSEHKSHPSDYGLPNAPDGERVSLLDIVAQSHQCNGFRFVPLVRKSWSLECDLSILLLRKDHPGSGIVHRGDLDNRVKTLLDALRFPETPQEAGGETPQDGEDPFFCLLEDDKFVSGLSVESGQLLEPISDGEPDNTVQLVVSVDVRPYFVTMFNLAFG